MASKNTQRGIFHHAWTDHFFIIAGLVSLLVFLYARGELDSYGLDRRDECGQQSNKASRLVQERVTSGKTLSQGLLWRVERIVRAEEKDRRESRRSADEHYRKQAAKKRIKGRYGN